MLEAIEKEANNPTVLDFPDGDNTCILDAMASLQTSTLVPDTFGEHTF